MVFEAQTAKPSETQHKHLRQSSPRFRISFMSKRGTPLGRGQNGKKGGWYFTGTAEIEKYLNFLFRVHPRRPLQRPRACRNLHYPPRFWGTSTNERLRGFVDTCVTP